MVRLGLPECRPASRARGVLPPAHPACLLAPRSPMGWVLSPLPTLQFGAHSHHPTQSPCRQNGAHCPSTRTL